MLKSNTTDTVLQFISGHKSYDFSIRANLNTAGDKFEIDKEGRVVGAQYASGAFVRINEQCMLVRAKNHSLWFADSQKQFHPID